ncbi:hypothetical protein BB559_001982 [Furculomyces boomerangus]|uniref:C2H2-type domain-containing protein n=2 Tax=Harpellales TaxID=61421 RepID=A0A2T9YYZ5_9FUNG|nr:hypothetical protein BB559_001982 [Furculomyces boomerangus]PVZ98204.1 hypothetical protein BB558_005795 [Smittium angustum]
MKSLYKPTKRRFQIEDSFFAEGNLEVEVAIGSRKPPLILELLPKTISMDIDNVDSSKIAIDRNSNSTIVCHKYPCNGRVTFPNPSSYEKHYNQLHLYVCMECHAVLPNPHWLDLHISECHDSFFQASVERGLKMYRCLLDSCNKTTVSAKMRKLHMIDKHKYPKNFKFNMLVHGQHQVHGTKNTTKKDDIRYDSTGKNKVDLGDLSSYMNRLSVNKTK